MNLRLFHRISALFRRDSLDRDFDAEISSHFALAIEGNLKAGMSPAEARRQALLQFGGAQQAKENHRDSRSIPLLDAFWQDLRFALRVFCKSPGFTAVAVFTLALGIGANTATFSVSNTFLRNPISFPEVDRLVTVVNLAPGQTEDWSSVSPADFEDWRSQSRSFASLAAYDWIDLNMTGVGEPVKLQGFRVTANFFDVLRATPLLGRAFLSGEDEPGRQHEAILSAGLWRRQFASDPLIVGRTVRLDGTPTKIIGVMKEEVRFPINAELWVPMALSPQEKAQRNEHFLVPVARLKQGTSLPQALAEMHTIQDRLRASFPQSETGWTVKMMTIGDYVAGRGHNYTIFLLCAVGFVLLIACANVINLLLARSTARQSEYAIRLALGASRSRLISQALVESVLLAMGGLVVGLLIGSWGISLIRGGMPPEVARYIPGWDQVRLDRSVFFYSFTVAFAAGLFAGLFPAFYGSRGDLNDTLKETGRGPAASRSRTRLRHTFVVAEIALSLVLLVGAALMVKGVQTLLGLPLQFDSQSVLTFRVALPASRYATPQQRSAFYTRLTDQLNLTPAVQSSAVSLLVPFSGGDSGAFSLENQPAQLGEYRVTEYNHVSPAFFGLLHVSMIEGREFTGRDSADSPKVAIISEGLAKRYWPGSSALGHRIKSGDESSKDPWATIVGVVSEINYNPWSHDVSSAVYFPFQQSPQADAYISVRSSSDTLALLPAVRAAVANVDPDQPIYDVLPLDRLMSDQIVGFTYVAVLMGVVGLMALLLSAVGVSGVMAFSVAQRKHETGIRMALGARPQDVLRLFIRNGLKLLALGLIIGLPIAFALARLLSSLLVGVHANDLVSFFGGALLLVVAVILACYIPARAATRIDPMIALRYE